jgi:hypothetical protein|tara:strand:- start:572 stop:919 length:348 start_codon:yes stop_codon:yes gene_type:complete
MKGELIAGIVSVLSTINGIIILIAKRIFDKKMKELEYKHISESDEREHKQELERHKETTTDLLYENLEILKVRIIKQVNKDIEQAESNAEKQILIDMVKIQCPGCYAAVLTELKK